MDSRRLLVILLFLCLSHRAAADLRYRIRKRSSGKRKSSLMSMFVSSKAGKGSKGASNDDHFHYCGSKSKGKSKGGKGGSGKSKGGSKSKGQRKGQASQKGKSGIGKGGMGKGVTRTLCAGWCLNGMCFDDKLPSADEGRSSSSDSMDTEDSTEKRSPNSGDSRDPSDDIQDKSGRPDEYDSRSERSTSGDASGNISEDEQSGPSPSNSGGPSPNNPWGPNPSSPEDQDRNRDNGDLHIVDDAPDERDPLDSAIRDDSTVSNDA